MSSNINISKLAEVVTDSYNLGELKVFLADYFRVRLDRIINPVGLGMEEIVWEVINYFDRRSREGERLVDLVREFERDRPGKINLLDLLVPTPSSSSSPLPIPTVSSSLPPPIISSTTVDINSDEVEFYFVVEPDRRSVPASTTYKSPTQAI